MQRKPEKTREEWIASRSKNPSADVPTPELVPRVAANTGVTFAVPPAVFAAWQLIEKVGNEEAVKILFGNKSSGEAPSAEAAPYEEPGLRLVKAGDVEMKRVRWLWFEKLAFGKLNLFCGNPDHGKSLVSLDVVARVTTGAAWPTGPNNLEPIEVLIVAAEDGLEDTIAPRLAAAKADLNKVHYLKSVITPRDKNANQYIRQLRLDHDIAAMEACLQANPNIRLVVIDPVSSYLGSAKMMDEQAVRGVLNPLVALAEKLGVCVLTIMHLNKKIDLDAVNRVGGAMAFVGIPRLAWVFAKKPKAEEFEEELEPDNTIYMMKLKGNIIKASADGLTFVTDATRLKIEEGEDFVPYVRWTGTTQKTMEELATKNKAKGHDSKSKQTEDWLLEHLSDREPKQSAGKGGIYDHALQLFGASKSTVDRVSQSLSVKKYTETIKTGKGKSEKVWFWQLRPDETVEVETEAVEVTDACT